MRTGRGSQAHRPSSWSCCNPDIPGSHTIILTGGREVDDDTMLMAASLAAYNSKSREAGKVPVDFTKVRYVSKPRDAKPGMVIYVNQQTMFVEPKDYPVKK